MPKELHDFGHIFNEKVAKQLPQHRSWDMKIDLVPGQPLPIRRPPILLSPEEKQEL